MTTKAGNTSGLVVTGDGKIFVYSYDIVEGHGWEHATH
jgi:hypothetical protein